MKTISVEISLEFDRKLRLLAAKMDLNRSELIRQVLEEKVAQLTGLTEAAQLPGHTARSTASLPEMDVVERTACSS